MKLHEKLDKALEDQEAMKVQIDEQKIQIENLKQQNIAIMMGMVDVFAVVSNNGGTE